MIKKAFIFIEILLFTAFMSLDIFTAYPTAVIKYLSIILCFLFSLTKICGYDGKFVSAAMLLTLVADLFLLVLGKYELIGVAVFCVVQLIYFARLGITASGAVWRLSSFAVAIAALAYFGIFSPLLAVTAFYFVNLVFNVINAFCGKSVIFAVGLLLFACCDICVGLSNAGLAGISFDSRIVSLGMWFFYLPSQVMIVLSTKDKEKI